MRVERVAGNGERAASRGRRTAVGAALLLVLGLNALPLGGQERGGIRDLLPRQLRGEPDFTVNNVPYDGLITFVRLRFTPSRTGYGGGGGYFGGINYQWDHDYPRADTNLMVLVDELTTLRARRGASNIIALDDPELYKYPVAYMSEPGFWTLTEPEARALRDYLLKGGFVIFDDFAGGYAFENLRMQLQKVLPEGRLQQLDATHPVFHSFFEIDSLNHQHPYYNVPSYFFGMFEDNDPTKRLLLIANYNNDIGESWEWSNSGFIPISLSNEAYKLGINYLVYAMTH